MQFLLEEALHERLDCERLLPELRRARAAELTDAVEEAKAAALAGLEER